MVYVPIFIFSFLFAGVQPLKTAPKKTHAKGAVVEFLAHPSIHKNKNAFIARLTVPAGGKVPVHRDKTEEYLYILEGQGTIWINGKKISIKTNDTIFMPANAEVKFENGPKKLVALQVFAGIGPEVKYNGDAWKTAPSVNSEEKAAKK